MLKHVPLHMSRKMKYKQKDMMHTNSEFELHNHIGNRHIGSIQDTIAKHQMPRNDLQDLRMKLQRYHVKMNHCMVCGIVCPNIVESGYIVIQEAHTNNICIKTTLKSRNMGMEKIYYCGSSRCSNIICDSINDNDELITKKCDKCNRYIIAEHLQSSSNIDMSWCDSCNWKRHGNMIKYW
jgi:hypothetical protein